MSIRATHLRLPLLPLLCLLAALACGGGEASEATPAATAPPASPTSAVQALQDQAEAHYLPAMSFELAELVRGQPWYESLSEAHLDLVVAIQRCERAATGRGEVDSVPRLLDYAAEQPWYDDGLADDEAVALAAVFDAYTESLADLDAPPIGPVLADTLHFSLFEAVALAESGQVVVMASATDEALGRQALDLATDALPQVEALVGAFPYTFLYIVVTDELPEIYAGVSYDEFIGLAPDAVDAATVVHEIGHSTLYGVFPTWFEEGFAHFLEYYLTSSLDEGVAHFREQLAYLELEPRLDLRPGGAYTFADQIAERAQGYLFLTAVYEIRGIDGMVSVVRSFRTKTFNDQDLLRAIVEQGDAEERLQLRRLVCDQVLGARRNYCVD